MKLIFVPGLGFTSALFSNLKLEGHDVIFLEWIEPLAEEKLRDYAYRMFSEVEFDPNNTVLIGHSFGGVLCQEVAEDLGIKKIILISSIVSEVEKPFKIKMLSPLKLSSIVTKDLIINSFPFWAALHGYDTKEERELYVSMISKQSTGYLRWAMAEISKWKPTNDSRFITYRIHGSKDQTFPLDLVTSDVQIVKGGNHFMVYKKAEEIEQLILGVVEV